MKKANVYVIGGGASGMLAAIVAKRQGATVTILERNPRVGKKILVTGNGRCNYTNTETNAFDYNNPEFVKYGLNKFSPEAAISFFNELGIVAKVENEGKTYPLSEQASSIIDVFLYELKRLNIEVVCEAFVYRIIKKKHSFQIFLDDGREFDADKVIIATGGKALASTGSDGSGYALAENLGHNIITPFPALVKIKLESPYLKHLQGIKMPAKVELIHQNHVIQKEEGDILFGNYGISGPTILQISRKANELFLRGEKVYIKIILVSQMTKAEVYDRFRKAKDKPVDFSLVGMINKRYISAILKESRIEKQKTLVRELSDKQLKNLVNLLFDWRFLVRGSKSFKDAQVTAGGVSVQEINNETMESLKVPGLYFTGEVMDIDGRCGGYNLQWAWASGYLAGLASSN
ncbi:MAG: NAD(P)/FAD-dependent oxidoreductase [Sphaerochaetaceae bacterium]|nr:NAD(P)/FAD-dependent oxidoreductase [Sphaerochaetaceae bacterium]